MKALTKNKGTAVLIVLALLAWAFMLLNNPAQHVFAGSPAVSPAFGVASSSAAVSVTTSTRLLASSTNPLDPAHSYTRSYAMICNPSATKQILIRMDGDKPADGRTAGGYWINANSCYEMTDKMLYQGSITASSSDQSAVSVLVTDYEY